MRCPLRSDCCTHDSQRQRKRASVCGAELFTDTGCRLWWHHAKGRMKSPQCVHNCECQILQGFSKWGLGTPQPTLTIFSVNWGLRYSYAGNYSTSIIQLCVFVSEEKKNTLFQTPFQNTIPISFVCKAIISSLKFLDHSLDYANVLSNLITVN